MSFVKLGARASKKISRNVIMSCRSYTESHARSVEQESQSNEKVPWGHMVANRITLYGVPPHTTPGDVRRAIAGKLSGVLDGTRLSNASLDVVLNAHIAVQIDYKAFIPSGKAHITLSDANLLGTSLHALKPSVSVCGIEVTPVPQYSSAETTLPRIRGAKGFSDALDRGVVTGWGPSASFPNIERTVVLWGVPGTVTVENLTKAITDFKVEMKGNRPVIIKLEKCAQFSWYEAATDACFL
ncbi:hypothetical protein H0H92_012314 [Tricholoma furcatifolium]|nr:hypothetical protein H0H92_012314 [Tricholoma furcatifolium]